MSGNGSTWDYDATSAPGEVELEPHGNDDLAHWTTRFSSTLNNKLSAKHKLRSGIIVSVDHFHMFSQYFNEELDRMETTLDDQGQATTVQAFTSWKWRWNEQWSMTSGVHVLHYTLNGSTSVEPRLGLRYQVRPDRAFTFGTGLHSRTEGIMTYMAQDTDADGNSYQPNRDLGLTRAAHFVIGYEQMLAEDIQLKVEAYYQHLYDMPVENDPTSSFSTWNMSEWFTNKPLVNEGVGSNYGAELAIEKFFTRGWHGMVTASLSDARYKALDGEWHNSRYNMGRVVNVLAGKEWKVGGRREGPRAGSRFPLLVAGWSVRHTDRPGGQHRGGRGEGGEPGLERERRRHPQAGSGLHLPRRPPEGEPRVQGGCAERAQRADLRVPILRCAHRHDQGCPAAGHAARAAIHPAVLRRTTQNITRTKMTSNAFLCLALGTTLGIFNNLHAQTTTDEPMKTLFGSDRDMHNGGWGAPVATYTRIMDQDAMLVGARGGWIIDHRLTLGIAGHGLVTPVENAAYDAHLIASGRQLYDHSLLATGYGGLLIEPIIAYRSPVHISLPIVLGAGGAGYRVYSDLPPDFDPLTYKDDVAAFFVAEAGIDLEFNMVRLVRLGIGASYRYTSDLLLPGTPTDALRGFNASMSIKVGVF